MGAMEATAVLDHPEAAEIPAVRLESLTKSYGGLTAVDDLTLEVPEGSVFGLIGPNGAGKTTTLAIMASILLPTSGVVEVAGYDPSLFPREVRRRIGFMPDVMGVVGDLRVDEYLEFFAAAYEVPADSRKTVSDTLLELVDLDRKRDAMVDSLSRGMKQRLSLARALVHDPDILILDEPASGLDPRARIELRGLLQELQKIGKTIVISSHILAELEDVCSDVAIMEAGRLMTSGSTASIRNQLPTERVVKVRLATGEEHEFVVESEDEQVELLRQLVGEGLPVVEYSVGRVLEDVFMQVTKGKVQ
ncbi:MAG TPA: ABC transporter ATP-binding protein [Actinomycetota bacterium]|nr:ABC transporter ATP-binding protein [Actinomycetota bacterium]